MPLAAVGDLAALIKKRILCQAPMPMFFQLQRLKIRQISLDDTYTHRQEVDPAMIHSLVAYCLGPAHT